MVDSNAKKQADVIPFPNRNGEETAAPNPPQTIDLATLYDQHVEYLTAMAFRVLGRDDDVEDVVQTTFVIAMERLHTLKNNDAVRFWLAGITINLCRRNLRKKALLRRLGFHSMTEGTIASNANTETDVLISDLHRLLDRLPANEKIAWVLRHVEGEDFASVSAMCDCSVSTAKRRVSAASTKLKRWFDA